MRIHLINPSDVSFGVAVITPRWLYVLAAATPRDYGDPHIVDETLEQLDFNETAAVKGDGDHVWPVAIADVLAGKAQRVYEGGRIEGGSMLRARWDLLPRDR